MYEAQQYCLCFAESLRIGATISMSLGFDHGNIRARGFGKVWVGEVSCFTGANVNPHVGSFGVGFFQYGS